MKYIGDINCYFCNELCPSFLAFTSENYYKISCKMCKCDNIQLYYNSNIEKFVLFKDPFTITVDYLHNRSSISKLYNGIYKQILQTKSILNISPSNLDAKLLTLLTFC
jgi:hypothetical protein